ncbi:MAG: hypothetical protein ACRD2L_14110, partial [Terriglobia bacterium]
MVSIDQFMALPIVWEEEVVFNRVFDWAGLGSHMFPYESKTGQSLTGEYRKLKERGERPSLLYWCRCFIAAAQR